MVQKGIVELGLSRFRVQVRLRMFSSSFRREEVLSVELRGWGTSALTENGMADEIMMYALVALFFAGAIRCQPVQS